MNTPLNRYFWSAALAATTSLCVPSSGIAATGEHTHLLVADTVDAGSKDTLRIEKRIVVRMRGDEDSLLVEIDSVVGKGIQVELDLEGLEGLEEDLMRLEQSIEGMETTEDLMIMFGDDPDSEEKKHKGSRKDHGPWKGMSLGTSLFYQSPEAISMGFPVREAWGTPNEWAFADDRIVSNWRMEINPYSYRQRLIGKQVGLTTGVGMDVWHIAVEQGKRLTFSNPAGTTGLEAVPVDSIEIRRNALRAGWIRVPLMLDFRTSKKPGKGFHAAVGIVGGLKLFSSYRRTYTDAAGVAWKEKYSGFGVNRFAVNTRFQAGFQNVALVIELPMVPFFEGTEEQRVGAITVGLHFTSPS
jgi:hypothetical protein